MKYLLLLAVALTLPACARYQLHDSGYMGSPVPRDEMERLAAAGVSEPVLIELVEKRGALALKADDLIALKKAGTPDSVVQKMIALERKEPELRVVDRVRYYPSYDPWYWGWGWGGGYGYHGHRHGLGIRIYR